MTLNTEQAKGGKLSLYADGEYVMTLSADIWYSLGYSEGCEIDEEGLTELKFIVSSRLAYAKALRVLTLRAHSADELYKKLIKDHSPEAAASAVERCREIGFIDDNDFAERYALELAEKKHYGEMRIRNELREKGIDRDITENVMNNLDFDFTNSITCVINNKYYSYLSDDKGRKKTVAALCRLGFSLHDIKNVMDEMNIPEENNNEY